MREHRASGPAVLPPNGAGDPELDRLLGAIRQRRLVHQVRERAALGSTPITAREPAGVKLGVLRAVAAAPQAVSIPSQGAEAGTVLSVRAVGSSVTILRVARPRGFGFEAGQAIKLGLPGAGVRRTYSIASAPQDEHLEFCIERVPGGRLSAQLSGVAPGARLELAPRPKGKLSLQSGKARHLMVATVTGIAPLRSILRDALSKQGSSEFYILHGASYADELPYADELAELAGSNPRVRYLPTVSRPGDLRNRGWAGRVGRVEAHVLSTLQPLGSGSDVAVYACGHPEMVGNVHSLLTPMGYSVSAEDFG
jgi:NAD(P)H-flavin reductase